MRTNQFSEADTYVRIVLKTCNIVPFLSFYLGAIVGSVFLCVFHFLISHSSFILESYYCQIGPAYFLVFIMCCVFRYVCFIYNANVKINLSEKAKACFTDEWSEFLK